MRIVIDMQGAQSSNRDRGIGRYTLSLTQAIARNRGEHEVVLALNGLFPDTIEPIRSAFDSVLPQENIRVWYAPGPVAALDSANDWRRESAERVYEAFLASLKPDIVYVSSLFEGLGDNAVTSIGALGHLPTAVTLYDLIPYIYRQTYLDNPAVKRWYMQKLEHMQRADLLLAISDSSKKEGERYLKLPSSQLVNVSTAADDHFRSVDLDGTYKQSVLKKYNLHRPFVMYTGGIDQRKNIEGLIHAFACLPESLSQQYQLAIVCSARSEDQQRLKQLARKYGLSDGVVVMTGFVPEDDLVALYNLCRLFVFPSWHEGFGLPALEAMSCGAPVIAANTSSLPEVVGWEEALFDPRSDESMSALIERALTDKTFRSELLSRAKEQVTRFSWDDSAKRTLAAFERYHTESLNKLGLTLPKDNRPLLAYVSPLPPARSGIADYSAELLPVLNRYYQIELIVAQDEVTIPQANNSWPVRTVEWFLNHSKKYDRVLYHFGNSEFHQHMFELLSKVPGVVVLHDFYLSGIIAHMELHGIDESVWSESLYHNHGYKALSERLLTRDLSSVIWQYPCSLSVIQRAIGIVVHSNYAKSLASQWYGLNEFSNWEVIPLMREPVATVSREEAREALGFSGDDFVVCSFGMLGPTKLNHRLINAWVGSKLSESSNCYLVFVGENHGGEYGNELLATIKKNKLGKTVKITGWAGEDTFSHYLAAADVGVQLRTLSRGETSAAVLDCMNYGLPTIVNANGSMADLSEEVVIKLPDEFSDKELTEALESLWQDDLLRDEKGSAAYNKIRQDHDPGLCGEQYAISLERFYMAEKISANTLVSSIGTLSGAPSNEELIDLANDISLSIPSCQAQRQLLVDISELVQRDSKSGIQRVVRSILCEWLSEPPEGWRVEPVYATSEQGYRYARRFTSTFLDFPNAPLTDEPIEFNPGDVFLGLDLQPHVVFAQRDFYQKMRHQGVKVYFVVYDLLCVVLPQYFVKDGKASFERWLSVVAENDGALCISKAVANEISLWLQQNGPQRLRPFKTSWFHLGADIDNSQPTTGLPENAHRVLATLTSRPTFLMVGTVEPRKGHQQVLDAFEQLWQSGVDVNFVIVGKQGWLVESLIERINSHTELDKRLFWLNGISDEYLEKVYANSTCLIAASYGEGFGLPLIEAAQHKLPIIARDIPVFREVAGKHTHYFHAAAPEELTIELKHWLALYREGRHPKSDNLSWLTWKESAAWLLECVLRKEATMERIL